MDQQNQEQQDLFTEQDIKQPEPLGAVLTIVSFCFPIIGIILYFSHKRSQPQKAQTACYAALAGFALGVLIRVATMSQNN